MEMENDNIVNVLEYNTHREKMVLPEYGRLVHKMVNQLKEIEDRTKRSEQARAVVRVMELLNPSIHGQDNWEQRLWDSLFVMAGYELDVDSPYPVPQASKFSESPMVIPVQKKAVKASHYGRNIESIIDLIAEKEDGDVKSAMLRDLAVYMRTQYLIWNKDSVSDATIFNDIEKLSDGRIKVPEGLTLSEISRQATFNRPGQGNQQGQGSQNRNRNQRRVGRRNRK